MPQHTPFIHKLSSKLQRLDRQTLELYLNDWAQANTQLYEILDQLTEGVVVTDPSGKIIFINTTALSWIGSGSLPDSKMSLQDYAADAELNKLLSIHLPKISQRLVSDVKILTPREMRLRVMIQPLETSQQNEILILLQDISFHAHTEDPKHFSIEALASLAAGIAHEIGNPLNAIQIHLQLLQKASRELSEAKQRNFEKALSVIQSETSRLDRIVRNFLKAARKPPLRFKTDDLGKILEEALRFLAPEMKHQKVHAELSVDKTIPPFLMDRERLHMAFINLLKNGLEAMPKGGTLQISMTRKGNLVSILFKDQGHGIDPRDLPHIFEAYYTTKAEGSGLGLMTVYQVIQEHGGRIEVSSKPGKGSLFMLHLPMRQPKLQLPTPEVGDGRKA